MAAPADLAAIERAADEAYNANPGPPVTPALASRLRPLIYPAADGQAAA